MSTTTGYAQQGRGWMAYPRRLGLLWAFYKAPLLLHRLGGGFVLRGLFRLLVLTTRGHRSGRPRHTMLEHTWHNGRAYIAPGWGERTLWYRNIVADPRVTVQRSGTPYGATAVRVTDDAELAGLYSVSAGKSHVWKQYLNSWGIEDTLQDYLAKKDRLIVLRLDPSSALRLKALRADLVWIWPFLAAALAAWLLLRS